MAGVEKDYEVIYNVQHSYNTKSKFQTSHESPPSTSVSNTNKRVAQKKTIIPEIEYNLIDDLKRDNYNISLFKLLKIPYMRENLPKSMILNKSREVQNNNNLET